MAGNNILQLSVMRQSGEVLPMQIDSGESVINLKVVLEVDSQIPIASQELMLNGKALNDSQTLAQNGVSNGDLLVLIDKRIQQQQQRQQQQLQQRQQAMDQSGMISTLQELVNGVVNSNGRIDNAQQHLDRIKANPGIMAKLNLMMPKVADIIRRNDVGAFENFALEVHSQLEQARKQQELLTGDPMDPEIQKRIEEHIQQEAVNESYNLAMEHHPELFFKTDMLYVRMHVNNVEIKAFVDTGAQMSIMTLQCAEKVNLMRMVDKRYKGMAMGVGTAEIVGRVHQAPIKIGDQFIPCAITILSQKSGPDFIFGLDMLKQHLCSVDLHKNVLRFGSINVELPFLTGDDLPQTMEDMQRVPSGSISNVPSSRNPQPSAQLPSQSASQANPVNQNQDLEQKIQQLMSLGFDRNECLQALQMMGGDVDQAAAALFASRGV
eukprot:TRINITY_DN8224_c0_g1_i1.p1 TRINITY_DN8224_c0_g1~~TRINITY_DN8224_c0_g1_i1.p1  ORF type:complete len:475 (-),score=64.28 TRINITY_DN8224_c0_g1_i1:242-1549(-)